MFEDVEEKLENLEVSEISEFLASYEERQNRWLEKRIGKITSSILPNLMKKGKGSEWGLTAKDELLKVLCERFTGVQRQSLKLKQFEWGHDYEPLAIEAYAERTGIDIISGSDGFDEIVFNEPFEGFGDSPDGVGNKLIAEIKCPENSIIHAKYCTIKSFDEKDDYYWQMLGHLIGSPESERCDFISFDPRMPFEYQLHVVSIYRQDHIENLSKLEERIRHGIQYVDMAYKMGLSDGTEFIMNLK